MEYRRGDGAALQPTAAADMSGDRKRSSIGGGVRRLALLLLL